MILSEIWVSGLSFSFLAIQAGGRWKLTNAFQNIQVKKSFFPAKFIYPPVIGKICLCGIIREVVVRERLTWQKRTEIRPFIFCVEWQGHSERALLESV